MKRYIETLCFMMLTVVMMTSCLNGDDDDVTYYGDAAITSFSLSAVNRYVHTTGKSGADSTYKASLTATITFAIDHYQQKIYNVNQLPSDCDLKHVLVTITAKNNGQIVWKSTQSDSLFYYNSKDSIDLSQPRELRVYALDGSGFRAYEVTLHQSQASDETFSWTEVEAADGSIPSTLYNEPKLANLVTDQLFFSLSADGANWTQEYVANGEDTSALPSGKIGYTEFPFAYAGTSYRLLAGNSDSDTLACVVWRQIAEPTADSQTPAWVQIPRLETNPYYLPKMSHVSLVYYDDSVLAFGTDGVIRQSRDQGITWKTYHGFKLPDGATEGAINAVADDNGYIWITNLDNGRVWKGRLAE